jgi:hypothetical protein
MRRTRDDLGKPVPVLSHIELLRSRRYRDDARLTVHLRRVVREMQGRTPVACSTALFA